MRETLLLLLSVFILLYCVRESMDVTLAEDAVAETSPEVTEAIAENKDYNKVDDWFTYRPFDQIQVLGLVSKFDRLLDHPDVVNDIIESTEEIEVINNVPKIIEGKRVPIDLVNSWFP